VWLDSIETLDEVIMWPWTIETCHRQYHREMLLVHICWSTEFSIWIAILFHW